MYRLVPQVTVIKNLESPAAIFGFNHGFIREHEILN